MTYRGEARRGVPRRGSDDGGGDGGGGGGDSGGGGGGGGRDAFIYHPALLVCNPHTYKSQVQNDPSAAVDNPSHFYWDFSLAWVNSKTVLPEMLAIELGVLDEHTRAEPTAIISRGICKAHALRWLHQNLSFFAGPSDGQADKAYKKQRTEKEQEMKADIMRFSNSPFPQHAAVVGELMLEGWRLNLREPAVADAFGRAWLSEDTVLLRSGLSPFGGIPNDNNALEGTNSAQKHDYSFNRMGLTTFLQPDHFPTWLSNQSKEDLHFCSKMDLTNDPLPVWNGMFFQTVQDQFERALENSGFFAVRFARQSPTDSSITWLDIPSRRIVDLLLKEYRIRDEVDAMKLAISHTGRCRGAKDKCSMCPDSWLASYRNLQSLETLPAQHGLDFATYMDLASCCHTLRPIVDVAFVEKLIFRLLASGMELDLTLLQTQGSLDVEKLKKFGFVSCSCPTYLKDLWCIHVEPLIVAHNIFESLVSPVILVSLPSLLSLVSPVSFLPLVTLVSLVSPCLSYQVTIYSKLKKLIVNVPPRWRPERIGPCHNGRIPKAVYGGALGYQ